MTTPKRNAGFTIIELLITLAVAAIVLAVAVPGFGRFIVNQQVKTTAHELLSALHYTRSEAIKRNHPVYVRANGNDWHDGWVVTTVTNKTYADCLSNRTGCLKIYPANDKVAVNSSGVSLLTYQRSGRLAGAANPAFAICDTAASTTVTRRVVSVDLSGRPNLGMGSKCNVAP